MMRAEPATHHAPVLSSNCDHPPGPTPHRQNRKRLPNREPLDPAHHFLSPKPIPTKKATVQPSRVAKRNQQALSNQTQHLPKLLQSTPTSQSPINRAKKGPIWSKRPKSSSNQANPSRQEAPPLAKRARPPPDLDESARQLCRSSEQGRAARPLYNGAPWVRKRPKQREQPQAR